MNEKFKLLALEAKMGTADFDAGSFYVATPDRMQKLCELIVRECVGVADDYVKDCICEEHINCKHPRSAIGRKIREHFGVEQ
jgi:hypothetical protein